jgi:hypothetical protein
MTTDTSSPQPIETLEIQKAIEIAAPIEIAFEAMLDELGPEAQMMDGTAMPFTLEAWPGGRWYRDLGNNSGHLWTDDDVLSRNEPSSISLDRSGERHSLDVRASRRGVDFTPAPRRLAQGMGALDRQDSRPRRTEGEVAKSGDRTPASINTCIRIPLS